MKYLSYISFFTLLIVSGLFFLLNPEEARSDMSLCEAAGHCQPICGTPGGSVPCIYMDCGYGTVMCYQWRQGLDR